MKIRFAFALVTTVVGATVLAGCAGGTPDNDGGISGTLTGVFDANYEDAMEEIVAGFEAEYPDVDVNFDYQGGDFQQIVPTLLQAGTAPDLLLTYPAGKANASNASANVVTLASQGRILELTEDWTANVPDAWNEGTVGFEGGVYAFPGAVQPLAAIYNQDTLDGVGLAIPETLDEVLQFCADAQAAGLYAYAQGLGETSAGPQMVSFAQVASLVYGPNPDFDTELFAGDASYPESGWVDQFEIYQDMFDAGCFGEGALGRTRQQGAEAVASGAALGQIDVGGQRAVALGVSPDANIVIAPIPATNDGETYVTALPGYTLAVNAETDNAAAARAFMEYLAGDEAGVIYANAFSAVPIIPNEAFVAPDALLAFAEVVAEGRYAKLAEVNGPVQTTLNEAVQSMLLGNDTPESVAQKMQDALDG
jgi:raffinose/stachyose/melibiose transport system substrate-binding protein